VGRDVQQWRPRVDIVAELSDVSCPPSETRGRGGEGDPTAVFDDIASNRRTLSSCHIFPALFLASSAQEPRANPPETGWPSIRWPNGDLPSVSWVFAFAIGLFGGVPLSFALEEFMFTWRVCLHLSFEAVEQPSRPLRGGSLKNQSSRVHRNRWQGRIAFGCFLLVCLTSFFLCLRLSLLTAMDLLDAITT